VDSPYLSHSKNWDEPPNMEVFICFSWENTIGIWEISGGSWDFKGNGWDLMEHHETSLLSDVFLDFFFINGC
jgi:hypothetical protein